MGQQGGPTLKKFLASTCNPSNLAENLGPKINSWSFAPANVG